MYAVIETGGKQYRVEVGTELEVELLDAAPGSEITLDRVLLVADGDQAAIGRPVVTGAAVSATVLRRARGEKLISFKYKPKTRRRVKKGHRQEQTILRIADIRLDGRSAAAEVAEAAATQATEREQERAAAAEKAAADAALAAKLAERLAAPAPEAETEAETAPPKRRTRAARPKQADEPETKAKQAEAPADAAATPADAPAKPRRARAPRKED